MSVLESVTTRQSDDSVFPSAGASVLVVDDDAGVCHALAAMLRPEGYEVTTAGSGREAAEWVRRQHFELTIADLVMPEMDGIQTLSALKDLDPDLEVIVMTGYGTAESATLALKQGACDFLVKPFTLLELRACLTRALEIRRLNTSLSLYSASRTLLDISNRQGIIPTILDLAQRTMGASVAGLALASSAGEELEIYLTKGGCPLEETAVKTWAQRAMQAHEGLRTSPSAAGHPDGSIPAGSTLAFPLEVRNTMQGALVLWRDACKAPFKAFELRSGEILANEIAMALENARLYSERSRRVEELEAAHNKLARAESQARAIIETAQEAVVLFDKEGWVWGLNPRALEMFGRPREQVVGRNLADFAIPQRLLGTFRNHVETAWREGRDPDHGCREVIALRQNGEEFPMEVSTAVIETPRGKLLSTFARDITERKRAEDRTRLQTAALESAANGIVIADRDGRILWVNPALTRLTGYSAEEVLGQNPRILKSGAHDAAFYQKLWDTILSGQVWQGEIVNRRKDGTLYTEEMTITPVRDAGGTIGQFIAIKQDVTERKQAEQALAHERDLLHALMDYLPDSIYFKDRQSRFLRINTALAKGFGLTDPSQAIGKTDFDFFTAEHAQQAYDDEQEVIRTGKPMAVKEEKETWPDGRVTWASTIKMPMRDGCGAVIGTFGVSRDITERKRAEQALWESEEQLKAILNNSTAVIYLKDTAGRYIRVNREFESLFGFKPGEVAGRTDHDLFPKEVADNFRANDQKVLAERTSLEFEEGAYHNGSTHIYLSVKFPLYDAEGAPYAIAGISTDITARKRAEQALRESEERYRLLFENNLAGVVRTTREGRILDCNPAMAKLMGYDSVQEVLTHVVQDFYFSEEERAEFLEKLKVEGRLTNSELRLRRKDGSPVWLVANISPAHQGPNGPQVIEGTLFDITERKRVEEALRDNEEKYRVLYESSHDAIMTIAPPTWGFTAANPSAIALFGAKDEQEFVAAAPWQLSPEYQSDGEPSSVKALRMISIAMERGSHSFEWTHKKFSGEEFSASVRLTRMIFRGQPFLQGHVRDITERKRAEQALRESEERYRRLFERNSAGVFQGTVDGHVLDCNDAYARILGYNSRQEILRLEKLDYFYDAQEGMAAAAILQRDGSQTNFEVRLKRRDGSPVSVLANVTFTEMGKGRPPLVEGTLIDITERKQAEQQARLLTTALESAANGILLADREGRILWVNPAFTRLSGYSAAEVVGENPRIWKSGAHDAAFYEKLWKTVLFGEVWQGEIINRRKDGTLYTEGMTITPVPDARGNVTHFIAIKQDISDRKRAEQALRESEQRYRELFENATDIVYTTDLDGRFTSLNRAGQQTLGYSWEEATQLTLWQVVAPKHREMVKQGRAQLRAGGPDPTCEVEVTAKDGRRVMLEVKPRLICQDRTPIGFQAIAREITGRDVAEMELRHAQKLESVGRLAAGIAHEINTPIQFVGDNARFLQDSFTSLETLLGKYQELRDSAASGNFRADLLAEVRRLEEESDCAYLLEEIPKALTQTLEGVDRVATIVRAMKEFAHPESKEMAAADLNKALLSTLTVARNELKYVAEVETQFGDLPLVVCNIGDLNQVFLNLLVNAAHAIADVVKGTGTKGKIRVSTAADGQTVLIAISDTGGGIPEAVRGRIFDPFFTTKEVGRGTGQGLAIARSVVVERHKGALTFETEVGKGTTFYVRLPLDPAAHT